MADGGIGESMLLGAAMGGGSSALMGRDPLKGALVGGLTGGVTGGISSALGGAAPTGITALPGATENAAANVMSQQPALQATQQALADKGLLQSGLDIGGFNPAQATLPNAVPPAGSTFSEGMSKFANDPMASLKAHPFTAGAASLAAMNATRPPMYMPPEYKGPLSRFRLSENYRPAYAEGGITSLAGGGNMSVGGNPMDPTDAVANTNWQANSFPAAEMASGGIAGLGSYSDGGRMLKGPGDGMSDSIPANIAGKRPARLADGEFVVPADVVSHLGNGSTDAGAKQLYSMMDKVRQARTGRKAQGREINPRKYVPA